MNTDHKLIYNESTHTYWLDGKRAKSVTSVAKMVADSFALDQWRKRQVAIGIMLEPRLAERIAADPDNREIVDRVCEDAMQIAGAHHAANRGKQRHRASELADTGRLLLTEQQRVDAKAWQQTIEQYQIQILPEYVEGFVIWPEQCVCGRFDRIGILDGRPVIIDLKSGENAVKYPHATTAQLALYANAPLVSAAAITEGDTTTVTEWTYPPDGLDLKSGYIVRLGDDMETGELWRINLEHGSEGAMLALAMVDWRKDHNYGRALAELVQPSAELRNNDHLILRINKAMDVAQLTDLWRVAQQTGTWTDKHTHAAQIRKAELERRHQPIRQLVKGQ